MITIPIWGAVKIVVAFVGSALLIQKGAHETIPSARKSLILVGYCLGVCAVTLMYVLINSEVK